MTDEKKQTQKKAGEVEKSTPTGKSGTSKARAPGLETKAIKYIHEYERQVASRKTISVFDRIGQPEFKGFEALDEASLPVELDRLLDLMLRKNVYLNVMTSVEEAVLYRFITEELFHYEMEDVSLPGLITCFTYETFHPNHEYDLHEFTEEGIRSLLSKDTRFWANGILLDRFRDKHGQPVGAEELEAAVLAFKNKYTSFTLRGLEIQQIEYDLNLGKAKTTFYLNYYALLPDTPEVAKFSGTGIFFFEHEYGYWYVSGFDLPGLDLFGTRR